MATALLQVEVEIDYILVLNLMRDKTESQRRFGPFRTKEEALAFHDAERVEPYKEDGPNGYDGGNQSFTKTFRKGGPLEWMNPLQDSERETPGTFGHGVHECYGETINVVELSRTP